MTIRMLQAWNGLHQQKIVTTLSGSDEAALVAAGIATYDLDGPSENLRMAQLATDAGGRIAGIAQQGGGVFPLSRADKLSNVGTLFWEGAPSAGMFTLTGESAAPVLTEATTDGGLRIYTSTVDKYIDVVLALTNPVVAKTAAVEVRNPSTTASVSLYLSRNSGFAAGDMISRFFGVNNLGTSETHRHGGRKWLMATGTTSLPWTNTGALDLDKTLFTHLRLRITPAAGQAADLTLFAARANVVGRSRIAGISDDGYSSWLKYAVPVFQRRGIPTSLAVIPTMVGFNTNYATLAHYIFCFVIGIWHVLPGADV